MRIYFPNVDENNVLGRLEKEVFTYTTKLMLNPHTVKERIIKRDANGDVIFRFGSVVMEDREVEVPIQKNWIGYNEFVNNAEHLVTVKEGERWAIKKEMKQSIPYIEIENVTNLWGKIATDNFTFWRDYWHNGSLLSFAITFDEE